MSLTVRAPGKLFLIGEYAVLDGCPGAVAAVDRFATVTLKHHERRNTVQISAPEINAVGNYSIKSLPPVSGLLRFPLAALHALHPSRRAALEEGVALVISSDLGGSDGSKPGLGSSAAVTVAVAAALLSFAGVDIDSAEGRNEVFATAWRAHRDAQGGIGSGADVAASVFGGVISLTACDGGRPKVEKLEFPSAVTLLVASSGRGASTLDLVARYRSLHNGHDVARSNFVRACTENVERFIVDLHQPTVVLEALRVAHRQLLGLAEATGLDLFTPELLQAIDIADFHGAAAKLSGAGGGDCAIACTTDGDSAQRIRSAWRAAGLEPLPLNIHTEGVALATR
ncbi:MAG: hypothetical protein HY270_07975 [Deltaproteobacteria bacterium]|nr:hypothetical protein [Deltaproteobacteria bacterium]